MAQFMCHQRGQDLRRFHGLIVRQLLNTGVEDIGLASPSIDSNESNPEVLTGRLSERRTILTNNSVPLRALALVFPRDRNPSIAVDPFRSLLCRFDNSRRYSRVVVHNNRQLWTFLRRTLDPST